MISDNTHFKGDPGRLGISDGRVVPRIRERHHKIGFDVKLFGQKLTLFFSKEIDILTKYVAVGPSEIDSLKDTLGLSGNSLPWNTSQAVFIDD